MSTANPLSAALILLISPHILSSFAAFNQTFITVGRTQPTTDLIRSCTNSLQFQIRPAPSTGSNPLYSRPNSAWSDPLCRSNPLWQLQTRPACRIHTYFKFFRAVLSHSEADSNFRGIRIVGNSPSRPSEFRAHSVGNHPFNRPKRIKNAAIPIQSVSNSDRVARDFFNFLNLYTWSIGWVRNSPGCEALIINFWIQITIRVWDDAWIVNLCVHDFSWYRLLKLEDEFSPTRGELIGTLTI